MVRKIKQWVPIDGTRWRNEIVNSHENDGVGIHYGFAHRGVMTPLRELPNATGLCGLCGLRHGGPGAIPSSNTKYRLTMTSITDPTPRGESL